MWDLNLLLAYLSLGIAAGNLPNGKTAHQTFGIPVKLSSTAISSVVKQSEKGKVLKDARLLIWDEAPMAHKHCFEVVDKLMKDSMNSSPPFGGKIIVLGGDFRQILPVVPKGTRPQIVNSAIIASYVWPHFQLLKLTTNVRAADNPDYQAFLLCVGDGVEDTIQSDTIK